jgi:hypothetical protein
MTTITQHDPRTNFEEPAADAYPKLLAIVEQAEPGLRGLVHVEEFRRAFRALGFMFRTAQPRSDLYFSSHVEFVNDILARWGVAPVGGNAAFLAMLAHNDIPIRRANRSIGQLLEAGLNPCAGIRCSNGWRGLLAGAPMLSPVAPDRDIKPEPFRTIRAGEASRI